MSGETTSVVTRQHHGRQLIAQRLARACRHDREDVAPAQHGSDDRLLTGAKLLMAEPRLECVQHFFSCEIRRHDDDDGIVQERVQDGNLCDRDPVRRWTELRTLPQAAGVANGVSSALRP